jgi:hypothetical protein
MAPERHFRAAADEEKSEAYSRLAFGTLRIAASDESAAF